MFLRGNKFATRDGEPRPSLARAIAGTPILSGVLGLLGVGLVWLILTSTLPYALASNHAKLALRLNPQNPPAVLAEAIKLRDELVRLRAAKAGANTPKQGEGASAKTTPPADIERHLAPLKAEIFQRAQQIKQEDPYNSTAYRLIAGVADDPDVIRTNMEAAVAFSRRERTALMWLIHDSYQRGEPTTMLAYADMLMRTNAGYARHITDYLIHADRAPEGRGRLSPRWRKAHPGAPMCRRPTPRA